MKDLFKTLLVTLFMLFGITEIALADIVFPAPPQVPEPATAILFGLGLLGLAGISRKK